MFKNQIKMKNIKEVLIGIFAVIGFTAIVTGFTNESVQEHTVPESHVWEMKVSETDNGRVYTYNKVTGEVRKHEALNSFSGSEYVIMRENVPRKKKNK